jgi:hypothetical protein
LLKNDISFFFLSFLRIMGRMPGLLPHARFSPGGLVRSCGSEPDLRSTGSQPRPSLAQPEQKHIHRQEEFFLRPPPHAPVSPSTLIKRPTARLIKRATLRPGPPAALGGCAALTNGRWRNHARRKEGRKEANPKIEKLDKPQ